MSADYLKERNIELLQQEIAYLEKRKTILYALRTTVFIIAIVFGIEVFINTVFKLKSVALTLHEYNWGWLLRTALFWFAINYFWGVRSNKKRLVEAKVTLDKLEKEKVV
jgi:hypothetical protein